MHASPPTFVASRVRSVPDSRSFERLFKVLAKAPPNVAAVTVDGFRVEFHPAQSAAPEAPRAVVVQSNAPGLIEGTPFPDDGSPLNPIDLVLFPPTIDARGEAS